jgi:preprotein translocase subunit SecF
MKLPVPEDYKKYMAIPAILLIVCTIYLIFISTTGGLNLDVDLKGGTQIAMEFEQRVDPNEIQSAISEYNPTVRSAESLSGQTIIIDIEEEIGEEIVEAIRTAGFEPTGWSQQTIGPALGESFFIQAQIALLIAFIAMAITVLIVFREIMPSFYVVLSAFSDIVEALVISQLFGMKLSLATFAALLLLLGYSVDTDVLLTTRILKNRGELKEKIRKAMSTGLTMTITTLSVLIVLYFVAGVGVIRQITTMLLIGLFVDLINTWLMNANLLRWYIEKNPHKALR